MIFAMVVCDYRTIYLPGVCDHIWLDWKGWIQWVRPDR